MEPEDVGDEYTEDFRSEDTDSEVEYTEYDPDFHVMLYLLGEDVGNEGSTSAAGPVPHAVVCPTLPEEVVEAVLVWLPAAAQARFRAVCKAWLALLTNPEFLRRSFLRSISRTTLPVCTVRYLPEEYDYKPDFPWDQLRRISPPYKSLKVDLSFLPEVFHSHLSKLYYASPGGFMCASRLLPDGMHLCVFNPMNQSFKALPILEKLWGSEVFPLMGTVIATESIPSFKVYVPRIQPVDSDDLEFDDVAIYSSISGEWKGFVGCSDGNLSDPPPVACNGELYTTVDSTPSRLVRLSTETGTGYWHVALPDFEELRGEHWKREFYVVGHRGRLLCCCGGIWMLDDGRQVWVEVAGRCPPDLLPGNPETETLRLKNVYVAGDLVVFFYFTRGDPRNSHCPVAYDMVRGFWRKVPSIIGQLGDVFQPMPSLRL